MSSRLARIAASRSEKRIRFESRSLGLMGGLAFRTQNPGTGGSAALRVTQRLLARGYIFLPEGNHGEVVSLTPPLTIPETALDQALDVLEEEVAAC